jgi:alkanesulfonate monooxygenase SsuD/methylene tetrahydromethanopterin reductase-like flavin-dependent oxidoreductase (luciferase family)
VVSHAQAIRAVAEAVLADQVGIDVVALGEHHRPEFAISSPETVLAGINRNPADPACLGRDGAVVG